MTDTHRADGDTGYPQRGIPMAVLSLIRLDYEQSLKFIDGVVRISATIRQTTTAAAVALIGLSIQNKSPELGVAAATLAVVMGLMDAYHGWLYNEALRRVTKMERIFRQAMSAQLRADDDAVTDRLMGMIDDFKIGALSDFPQFTPQAFFDARPGVMYTIYPLTIVGGIVAAVC